MNEVHARHENREAPVCPVLEIHLRRRGFWGKPVKIPTCPHLSSTSLNYIQQRVNHRKPDWERIAREVIRSERLPGLVMLCRYNDAGRDMWPTRPLDIPTPFQVVFEPLELDQRDAHLVALCCESPGIARETVGPERDWTAVTRCCTFVFILIWFLVAARNNRLFALAGFLGASVSAVGRWVRPRWFILPGAVVAPGRFRDRLRTRLTRFTPADSILLIKGEWRAELHSGGIRAMTRLTDFECGALLAAWLSPLRSKPLEGIDLVDAEHPGDTDRPARDRKDPSRTAA